MNDQIHRTSYHSRGEGEGGRQASWGRSSSGSGHRAQFIRSDSKERANLNMQFYKKQQSQPKQEASIT